MTAPDPTIEYSQHNPWCEWCRYDKQHDGEVPEDWVSAPCPKCKPTATLTLDGTEPVEVVKEWVGKLRKIEYVDRSIFDGWVHTTKAKITTRLLRFTGQGDLAKVLSAADPRCEDCYGAGRRAYRKDEGCVLPEPCPCRAIDTSGIDGVVLDAIDLSDRADRYPYNLRSSQIGSHVAALREWAKAEGKAVYE